MKNNEESNTKMTVLVDNTSSDEYGLFTDKIVVIEKDGQVVILGSDDLKKLETALGCSFTR